MTPPLVSLPVLEAALADIFTNPFARESVKQAFADNDPYCAALVLTKLVERRVAAAELATEPCDLGEPYCLTTYPDGRKEWRAHCLTHRSFGCGPAMKDCPTTPERPALPDPQAEGGTPARVSLDTLVEAARQTV